MAKALTIPQRLEWLLNKRGVSQNALARVAKISPQTVANTLRHGRIPQAKTTAKFARTLGVPASVFTARSLTDEQLAKIVAAQGSWRSIEKGIAVSRPATKKKTTARKPAAKKKTVARKTVARKTVARKTVARKPVARKTIAKKPVARKSITARKSGVRTIVRHSTKTVAKRGTMRKSTARPAARKSTISRSPVRGGLMGLNGRAKGIDFDAIVGKLQKLANSRSEQVALDACKALLSLR